MSLSIQRLEVSINSAEHRVGYCERNVSECRQELVKKSRRSMANEEVRRIDLSSTQRDLIRRIKDFVKAGLSEHAVPQVQILQDTLSMEERDVQTKQNKNPAIECS